MRRYLGLSVMVSGFVMLLLAKFFFFSMLPLSGIAGPAPSPPVVILNQGTYKGTISATIPQKPGKKAIESFLGIPYANSKDRRFQLALHAVILKTKDPIDATRYKERCDTGEICLFANIFRQTGHDPEKKLPVAVYVHGGGFSGGSGDNVPLSNMLAWSKEAFVGVTFNYRLGALGFLPSKVTSAEDIVNLGLKDQLMLLKWVQANIGAFGGDPGKVTLMGSSAGAHSVGHHLLNTEGNNLFHRVILESGAPTARLVRPYNYSLLETQFKEFISATGIVTGSKIIDDLRSLTIRKIKEASAAVTKKYNNPNDLRWAFQPAIEPSSPSSLIRKAPIKAWNAGEWNKVPILTGYCTDEGSIFVDRKMSTSEQFTSFFKKLLPNLSPANIDRLSKLYPAPNVAGSPYADHRIGVGAQFKRVTAAYGQFAYISPVRQTAHYASTSPSAASVYLYEFAQNMSVNGGARHVANSGFTMYDEGLMLVLSGPNKDRSQKKLSPTQEAMVKTLHAYWTSFIVSGNPNTHRLEGSPEWPTYAPAPTGGTGAGGEDKKVGKNKSEVRENIMVFGRGNDEHAGGTSEGVVAEAAMEVTAVEEAKNLWWEVSELAESY